MMVTLFFAIVTATGVILEQGTITARTCQQAMAYAQAGLRPHQRLDVDACVERDVREVRR